MQSPVNFARENNPSPERLLKLLDQFAIWVGRNLTGTVSNITVNVSSGAGGSSGGGGSSPTVEYRAATFAGSTGTVSVIFSSPMSSGGFRAYVFIRDVSGTYDAVPMDENKLTKGAAGFTFTAAESITGFYFCILDA